MDNYIEAESFPSAKQLMLPFLELMEQGANNAAAVYDMLADQFELSPMLREKVVLNNVSFWRAPVDRDRKELPVY